MIITNNRSTSAQGGADTFLRPTVEEHTLERSSALESSLQRANEHIEMLMDMLHRQNASGIYDHAMLEALVQLLSEKDLVDVNRLESLWRGKMAESFQQDREQDRVGKRTEQI
ncbi:MAG: hypothetical protein ACREAC_10770, partial [Blastocatellia bacterium]